jgi:hypothetical protein
MDEVMSTVFYFLFIRVLVTTSSIILAGKSKALIGKGTWPPPGRS